MEDDHNSEVPEAFSKCPFHDFPSDSDTSWFAPPGLCLADQGDGVKPVLG